MSGLFVTFEGVEGCGKSTQLKLLKTALEAEGHNVSATREPGGTPIAESIRELLLDPDNAEMGPATELLLYHAARAQHVHEKIAPALAEGQVVLCDRFADSTTAYQGAGRGFTPDVLKNLHAVATGDVTPELTLLIDLDVEIGLERARTRGRKDRLEREAVAFHQRVRDAFLALAADEPDRVVIIEGNASIETIAADVLRHVQACLAKKDTP
jgi:dTMP kinase